MFVYWLLLVTAGAGGRLDRVLWCGIEFFLELERALIFRASIEPNKIWLSGLDISLLTIKTIFDHILSIEHYWVIHRLGPG